MIFREGCRRDCLHDLMRWTMIIWKHGCFGFESFLAFLCFKTSLSSFHLFQFFTNSLSSPSSTAFSKWHKKWNKLIHWEITWIIQFFERVRTLTLSDLKGVFQTNQKMLKFKNSSRKSPKNFSRTFSPVKGLHSYFQIVSLKLLSSILDAICNWIHLRASICAVALTLIGTEW